MKALPSGQLLSVRKFVRIVLVEISTLIPTDGTSNVTAIAAFKAVSFAAVISVGTSVNSMFIVIY